MINMEPTPSGFSSVNNPGFAGVGDIVVEMVGMYSRSGGTGSRDLDLVLLPFHLFIPDVGQ